MFHRTRLCIFILTIGAIAALGGSVLAQSIPLHWENEKIVADDTEAGDRFCNVAIDGDTMVVAAPGRTDNDEIYVFERIGGSWIEKQMLTSPSGTMLNGGLSIHNDTIAVGSFSEPGGVDVFVRSGGTWAHQAQVFGDDTVYGDYFGGWEIAVHDDTLAVGMPALDNKAGNVYIFVRNSSVWNQQAKLRGSGVGGLDRFGHFLDIEGDTLLTSAWADDAYGFDQGAGFVFERTGSTWNQTMKINRSGQYFGRDVALDGDTFAIGASRANRVYVFVKSGGTWVDQADFSPPDADYYDGFGEVLALEGDTLIFGSQFHNDGRGKMIVYERSSTTWTETAHLEERDAAQDDRLGCSIALADNKVYLGNYGDDNDAGTDAGALVVYDLESPNDHTLVGWWKADGDATDSALNNHGTLRYDTTFVTGLNGQAFSFDGDQDHVEVLDDPSLEFGYNEGFTIDLWIYFTELESLARSRPFLHKYSAKGLGNGFGFYERGHEFPGQIGFTLYCNDGHTTLVSNTAPSIDRWTHIAFVRDGDTGYIYFDGVLDASGPISLVGTRNTTHEVGMNIGSGRDDRNSTMTQHDWGTRGHIDSVGIFKKSFSATEIETLYEIGPGAKGVPTVRVPEEYSTIQAAVDAAGHNYRILVSPGTYNETIDFGGKAVTISGQSGAKASTILDGTGLAGSVVTFDSGEGRDSQLDGVTIINGDATAGGAINVDGSSPTIANCIIHDNTATSGGGISANNSSPLIINCILYGNTAVTGGGIDVVGGSAALLVNNTVSDNTCTGGGAGLHNGTTSATTIHNSILWGNSGGNDILVSDGTVDYDYCDIGSASGGTPGVNNISADPDFVDSPNGDYHLTMTSPCVDVGDNAASNLPDEDCDDEPRVWDGDNNGTATVDMGADENNNPDLVELAFFKALGYGNMVMVNWETASEIDTAGFHIWRSWKRNPAESDFERITGQLIPAEGGPSQGTTYHFFDMCVVSGHPYCYRLEDIDLTGKSTFHDPAVARWWMPGVKHH